MARPGGVRLASSRAVGHGLKWQPSSPLDCCIITGAGRPAPGTARVTEAEPVAGLVVDDHVPVAAQRAVGGVPGRRRVLPALLVDDHEAADPARPHAAAHRREARHRARRGQHQRHRAAARHPAELDPGAAPAARVVEGLLRLPANSFRLVVIVPAGLDVVPDHAAYVDAVPHPLGAVGDHAGLAVARRLDRELDPEPRADVLGTDLEPLLGRALDLLAVAAPLVADPRRLGVPAPDLGDQGVRVPGDRRRPSARAWPAAPCARSARSRPRPRCRSARRRRSRSPAPRAGGRGRRGPGRYVASRAPSIGSPSRSHR